jgi:hypothetical protein
VHILEAVTFATAFKKRSDVEAFKGWIKKNFPDIFFEKFVHPKFCFNFAGFFAP